MGHAGTATPQHRSSRRPDINNRLVEYALASDMHFSFRFDEGCVYPVFGDENHVEQTVVENVNEPVLQE